MAFKTCCITSNVCGGGYRVCRARAPRRRCRAAARRSPSSARRARTTGPAASASEPDTAAITCLLFHTIQIGYEQCPRPLNRLANVTLLRRSARSFNNNNNSNMYCNILYFESFTSNWSLLLELCLKFTLGTVVSGKHYY